MSARSTSSTRSHYELLGIAEDASTPEIKTAYRRLARALHPDTGADAPALFGLVTDAHDVLVDPAKRASYDRSLKGGSSTSSAPTEPPPNPAQPQPKPAPAPGSAGDAGRSDTAGTHREPPRATPHPHTAGGPTAHRPQPRQQPAAASAGQPAGPAPLAWWTWPAAFAALLACVMLRFTGLTAAVFGIHPGDRIALGATYTGTVALGGYPVSVYVQDLIMVGFAAAALVAGYLVRKHRAPVPRTETVLLAAVAGLLSAAGEFVLALPDAWYVAGAAVAVYGAWWWVLGQLPRPGTADMWASFPVWWKACWASRRR